MSEETTKPSDDAAMEDPRITRARLDEEAALLPVVNAYLQDRCVRLNAEVQARDEQIQSLLRMNAGLTERLNSTSPGD